MDTRERAWHNVQRNETTRIPRRYVFMDSESKPKRERNGHSQTWRLAVASFVSQEKGRRRFETWRDYKQPKQLWTDVSDWCKPGARTVLWAHNLGYDIRITQALEWLPKLGWRLVAHNIAKSGVWMEWTRNGARLVMADSITVYGTKLAKVGEYFGIGKLAVDLDCDDDEVWFKRCRRDVEILQTAMLAYLEWLESGDMGNWQITGAGQSWATFRHKFLTHKMVVHDDERALSAERRAMWAGRCEAYWLGEIRSQTVHEWDFTQAYARIARDWPVPVRLIGPMPPGYDWRKIIDSDRSALLARVTVDTQYPVVPMEKDGRILWPVGHFQTTLWDVEIRAALDAGATVTIEEGWLYALRPALKAWAEWIIGELESDETHCPTWRKQVLKHWSRALIGRMAMTYNSWTEFAEAPDSKVQFSQVLDSQSGQISDMMQVGHTVWLDEGRTESPNSMPMVTGYVQAIARVQLWNVLKALPKHVALYADTDSLLCTGPNSHEIERVRDALGYSHLRLKRSWDGFTIRGPRQVITGDMVRVAGVPRDAKRVSADSMRGAAWDSLAGSLRRGHTGSVTVRNRKWTIKGTDHRRDSNGFGWTKPIMVGS